MGGKHMAYTVGEMARRLGVPASTIRYYSEGAYSEGGAV